MELKKNPFYVLNISCKADRRRIMSAASDAAFLLDSSVCSEAQNALLNPSRRLAAELDWFLDSDYSYIDSETNDFLNAVISKAKENEEDLEDGYSIKDDDRNTDEKIRADKIVLQIAQSGIQIDNIIDEVRRCIETNSVIPTEGLTSITRLNASLHNFAIEQYADQLELGFAIMEIDRQYSMLNVASITHVINLNRSAAGIANVSEHDVTTGLNEKRDEIRQIVSDKLAQLDENSYIALITILADRCIARESYSDGVILSDVIDQYEVKMQTRLEDATLSIEKSIQLIRNKKSCTDAQSDQLIQDIEEWDRIAQPLQLKALASGMTHEISQSMGERIRALAVFLHNECDATQQSIKIVKAMKGVFAELLDVADKLKDDEQTLEEIDNKNRIVDSFKSKIDALEQIYSAPVFNKVSAVGLVVKANEAEEEIESLDIPDELYDQLYESLAYKLRDIAVRLYNDKKEGTLSIRLTQTLIDNYSHLSTSLNKKLAEDKNTLLQNIYGPLRSVIRSEAMRKFGLYSLQYFQWERNCDLSRFRDSYPTISPILPTTSIDEFLFDSELQEKLQKKLAHSFNTQIEKLKDMSRNIVLKGNVNDVQEFLNYAYSIVKQYSNEKKKVYLCVCQLVYCILRNTAVALKNNLNEMELSKSIILSLLEEFHTIKPFSKQLTEDAKAVNLKYRSLPLPSVRKYTELGIPVGVVILIAVVILASIVAVYFVISNNSSNNSRSSREATISSTTDAPILSTTEQSEPEVITSTTTEAQSYTVTLDKDGGTGGSSSISVRKGEPMPTATAPTKTGYVFKGYYSHRNGTGAQYYDGKMNSVRAWAVYAGGTLYACWEKTEASFSQSSSIGDKAYLDVKSIEPYMGIYTVDKRLSNLEILSSVVCKCTTSGNSIAYVVMSTTEYTNNIDKSVSSTDLKLGYFDVVTFSSAKRIHGIVRNSESECDGLAAKIGTRVLEFSSIG